MIVSEYNSGYLGSQIVALLQAVDILTEGAVAWPWEPYDPDTEYVPLSKVTYQGSSYICIQECRGVAPTDTDYWLIIAQGGRGVEFNVSDTHIQYRYTGDAEWINVIAIADLKGEEGDLGKGLEFVWDGTKLGVRAEGTLDYSYVDLKGDAGDKGDPGNDGRPIEFRETATHIQWRYVGDTTWNNLFALTSLKGDTGSGLEFNWNGTQLGIRVEGETSYQYIDLKGEQGDPGNDGADGKGIVSIARTSGTGAAGTTDTYTITFTDSTTATFQVYNGADGQGAGDMLLSVYDPTGKNTDIFGYVDNKVKTDVPAGAKFTDTVYTHPASHPPSIIAQDASNRFVSDTEKSAWNSKAAGTHSHAQSDVTGLSTSLSGKVDKVTGKGLSTEDYTTTEKNKLAGIEAGAQVNTITSVAGKTGAVTLAKSDVGLGNVDNVKQMPIAGGTFTGAAVAQTNTSYTTAQLRNVVMSPAEPSGGNNGDIWIKYE